MTKVTTLRKVSAPDHRRRTAEQRRERMRAKLMDATLALYQPSEENTRLVIDDLIDYAEVSRGTFYKYFDSVEAAITQVAEHLVEESIRDYQCVFAHEADATVRAIGGSAISLARAWHDPRWGGFTCRINYVDFFGRHSGYGSLIRSGLHEARANGDLKFESTDAAIDMILGASIEGRRRMMLQGRLPKEYASELLSYMFQGIGLKPARCAKALTTIWCLLEASSTRPSWWLDHAGWH